MRSPRVRVITFIPCTCCIYPSKTGQYRTSVCSGTLSISMGLVCSFCPSGQDFAAGFLQIPPRDGHPCLKLTLPTAKCVRDFHPIVMTHAGRTESGSDPFGLNPKTFHSHSLMLNLGLFLAPSLSNILR